MKDSSGDCWDVGFVLSVESVGDDWWDVGFVLSVERTYETVVGERCDLGLGWSAAAWESGSRAVGTTVYI